MLPVIISEIGGVPGGLDERFEQDRGPADDVAQDPRNNDNQVLLGARRRRRLKTKAWLTFLGQQIPTFQFDAHERIVTRYLPESHVGECLRLPDKTVERIPPVGIPRGADQVEGPHHLLFNGGSQDGVQGVQVRCHDAGDVRLRAEINR